MKLEQVERLNAAIGQRLVNMGLPPDEVEVMQSNVLSRMAEHAAADRARSKQKARDLVAFISCAGTLAAICWANTV